MLQTEINCIDDDDTGLFVTGTDDEITECQTTRKKLQSMAISPVSSHAVSRHSRITNAKMKLDKVMNIIKSNIPEAYKVQVDCWEDSEFDSYRKNDMKEKANGLERLHKAMQGK